MTDDVGTIATDVFGCAALGMINVILAFFATRNENFQPALAARLAARIAAALLSVAVLLVSAATGFGLGLPGTFLPLMPKSDEHPGIALFFCRLLSDGVCRTVSRSAIASADWQGGAESGNGGDGDRHVAVYDREQSVAAMPAAACWALCTPCYSPRSSRRARPFSWRNRGLATTLVLAFFDMGTLVGSPIAGGIVSYAGVLGLPAFGTMFVAVAVMIGASAAVLLALLCEAGLLHALRRPWQRLANRVAKRRERCLRRF